MSEDISAGISGALPKGEANGLNSIVRDMADFPKKVRVAVILFDCKATLLDHDNEDAVLRARIRRIEAIIDPDDAAIMQRILMRQFERRTGKVTLPFDLESDIKSAFDGVTEESVREDIDAEERGGPPGGLDDIDAAIEESERLPDEIGRVLEAPEARFVEAPDDRDPTAGPWPKDEDEDEDEDEDHKDVA